MIFMHAEMTIARPPENGGVNTGDDHKEDEGGLQHPVWRELYHCFDDALFCAIIASRSQLH